MTFSTDFLYIFYKKAFSVLEKKEEILERRRVVLVE